MTAPDTRKMTIQAIKHQAKNIAAESTIPTFWITDWLLYIINKPATFLMTDSNYLLSAVEQERFTAGVTQMQQGMPLAYLTGNQEFWSLNFKVNEHTLIPRPDTEILVEHVLAWIASQSDNTMSNNAAPNKTACKRLLDLGTGSGCIAISLAYELQHESWQVVAVDFSTDALEVARYNAIANQVDNIEFVHSSWYENLSTDSDRLFDVIVSNPPYIDENDAHLAQLQAEPISALSAPNHGMADIEHIVQHACSYLKIGGLLAIEHGFDQGLAVRQLFLGSNFDRVRTIQDFGGNDRLTLGQLMSVK